MGTLLILYNDPYNLQRNLDGSLLVAKKSIQTSRVNKGGINWTRVMYSDPYAPLIFVVFSARIAPFFVTI